MARTLITDDEPLALRRLEAALTALPEVEIVGAAANAAGAMAIFAEARPDIVVLDVEMPGADGFALAERMRAARGDVQIIFLTGSDRHAARAFEIDAADFLLKPAPLDRLREALRRAQRRLTALTAEARLARLQSELNAALGAAPAIAMEEQFLWMREARGLIRVPIQEVDRVEADGDYVIAHVGGATHQIHAKLYAVHDQLGERRFLKVSRSLIVNIERIRAVRRRGRNQIGLVLQDNVHIPVGPTFRRAVFDALRARNWRASLSA
jgi:DNA-binding LytR/AlgR family response regulator